MFSGSIRFGACAVVVLGLAGSRGLGAEKEKPAGTSPDAAAMAKAMEEFARPGPAHQHLKDLVGRWKTEARSYWPDPGKPEVSEGTATFKLLLGGRFVQQQYMGKFEGQKFEGLGISGYDNALKKYVSVWVDNMGTGIMQSQGDYDRTAGTLTEVGQSSTPMGRTKFKTVVKPEGKDKFLFTMYMVAPDGGEQKAMEITYTREK